MARAIRLVQKPDVNLEDVGDLVSRDSALVADLIRLSNSAIFSRGTGCSDLQVALQRLGLKEVLRAIALSLSKNLFGNGLNRYGLRAAEYWRSSVLAALIMEQFANIHGVDTSQAYTVGILHALGRILINEVLGEVGSNEIWDRTKCLENWEVSQVGFTHAEAGTLLLKEWAFPSPLVAPVENQLGPTSVISASSPTGMLRLTRRLLTWDPMARTTPEPATFPPDVLGWAGFASEEELMEVLIAAQSQLEGIAQSLNLKFDAPETALPAPVPSS
jgi:HD-like signal output (HDOD) protein